MASRASNHPEAKEGESVAKLKRLFQAKSTSSFPIPTTEVDEETALGSGKKTNRSQSTPDNPKVEGAGQSKTLPSTSASRGAGNNARIKQGQKLSHADARPLNSQSRLFNTNSLPAMKLATNGNSARERPPIPAPYASYKGNSSKQPGAEQIEFVEEGPAIPLSDVAKHDSIKLPQLFKAKSDYTGSPAVREGEMLLVQYKKTIKVAHGTTIGGHRVTLTNNCKLLLTHLETEENRTLTAKTLLSLNSLPLAMVVMTPFEYTKRQTTIKSGTILLPAKRESNCSDTIVAEDTTGQIVNITASCPGFFSIHPHDIQLHLVQLVHHCKLPAKVYLEGSSEAVTLKKIDQQEVLVAQPFSNIKTETTESYEFPADCNLQVVRVVSCANKRKASKIQYYSMFRQQEEDDDDDDPYLYCPMAVQWRNVPPAWPHSAVILTNTQQSGSTLSAAGASASFDNAVKADSIESNIMYLKSLRLDEVIELLEAMQLEEYTESFKREKVDGEVLSSLTEADLLRELNIQKRLHRVRLLKVIEGIHSVQANFRELYI